MLAEGASESAAGGAPWLEAAKADLPPDPPALPKPPALAGPPVLPTSPAVSPARALGGGSFADETSWNIKDAEGGTLASGVGEDDDSGDDDCGGWFGWGCRRRLDDNSNTNTFCTSACFSTVCEEGQQPNRDDECESCAAGKFKDAAGNAACVECVPGSYSTVVGSVSAADCQQVS